MEKKKLFIFIPHGIVGVAGMELHTAGLIQYLESVNCGIRILTNESRESVPIIPCIRKYYAIGSGLSFLETLPYKYKKVEQEYFLNVMVAALHLPNHLDEYDIFIESYSSPRALWAELLAAKLNARHIFIASEENYREPQQCYVENFPFFYFKLTRNEIIGSVATITRLFNGYKNVEGPFINYPEFVREAYPIQDVEYPLFDHIQKLDWNICHIGRPKDYVPHAIMGVSELAKRHSDKTISFLLIGNANPYIPLIKEKFNGLNNVSIHFSGVLFPIPRIIFSKFKVVLAISQTAMFAANEDALTIVGTADKPDRTSGVLGYDTDNTIYGKPTYTYLEALENIFVKRLYDNKQYQLPKLTPSEEYYKNIWTILDTVTQNDKQYYTSISEPRIRDWTAIFPFGIIARGARVILFGATEIAKDYRKQIESQNNSQVEFGEDYVKQMKPSPYCKIIATLDEHPEEFDNEVVGAERLREKDYDAIIITTFPQNAQSAYNAIVKTVPEMANRVVYNFQILPT